MTPIGHAAARHLLLKEAIESLTPPEQEALAGHLEACPECAAFGAEMAGAISSQRGVSIHLPPLLAERTRTRLYLHAGARSRETGTRWALWVSFALSWVTGIATAPLVWQAFEWIGRHAPVPEAILRFGFALWWILPAVAAAGILLAEKTEILSRRD